MGESTEGISNLRFFFSLVGWRESSSIIFPFFRGNYLSLSSNSFSFYSLSLRDFSNAFVFERRLDASWFFMSVENRIVSGFSYSSG